MKGIFKKAVVFSLLGIMLTGFGASATEASARHAQDNNPPRYEQHDNRFNPNSNRDHHKQLEKQQWEREMQQRERLQKEREQREREMRDREHREDKDDHNDLAVGLGALALLSVILNNN
ncbi:MAG: hypothetical protein AAGU75_12875 [Bacillota bacterium]